MKAAGARLDAYAHNPYPEQAASETPTLGRLRRSARSITMASLDKLIAEVQKAFGPASACG